MALNDTDFVSAIDDFKKGGWIVALLGGLGVIVRWMLSDENHPAIFWVQRIVAGSAVGVITYFALYYVEMDAIYKSIILSTSGAFSPELFQFVKNKIKKTLKVNV